MPRASGLASSFRLASQSAVYFSGYLFTFLVGFAFQFYLARQLGASGLGVYGLAESAVQAVAGLMSLGVAQTVARYVPQHLARGEHAAARRLIVSGAWILLAAGVIGYGAIAGVLPWLGDWRPDARANGPLVLVVGITLPLGLLMFFCMQVLRGFQDIRYMVIGGSFFQLSVKVALAVILFRLGYGLIGYAWAVVLSIAAALAWMAVGLRRHLGRLGPADAAVPAIDPLLEWRRYAGVMYAGSLLSVVSAPIDRFFVAHYADPAAVGVLLVALTLQELSAVFLQMFVVVIGPMFAGAHGAGDTATVVRLYHQCTDWLVRLSLPLVIFLFVFAGPVLSLYGPAFAESGKTVLWILLVGQCVNLATGPLGNLLNMTGSEQPLFRLALIQTIGMSLCYVVLIPNFGLNGAAVGTVAGTVFLNVAAVALGRRSLGLRWWDPRYSRWFIPSLATVAAALAGSWYIQEAGMLVLLLALILLSVVFHATYFAQGLHADDREFFGAVSKRLGLPW